MPKMDPSERTMKAPLTGDPPNPINPPSGCRFHPRCIMAEPVCQTILPPLTASAAGSSQAACLALVPQSGHSLAAGLSMPEGNA
jgi:peptide/nickel transport system ATP-binding protein